LLQAAAKHFGTDIGTLRAENSFVISPSGGRVSFGALAKAAAAETLPEDYAPNLKARGEWNVIGTSEKNKVAREIVTGKPLYGMDMDYPGAKAAMIERSPYLDGYVENVDDTAARALPGVLDVIVLDRPDPAGNYTYLAAGVAVVAEDVWTAKKARGLLKITWNKGPHTGESSQTLNDQCEELLKGEGEIVRSDGDFAAAVAAADKVITRTYKLPLVSHAQLEPQNCIAHVREDSATVIGPFQSPSGASRFASAITGIDRLSIEVCYTRLGGGFGRRLTSDHAAEAVTIAKQSGYPIRLVWTREDDLQHDFYRPMGHHEMTAAVDGDGKVTAWAQRLAGTPKYYRRGVAADELFGADLYVDDFPAGLVDNLKLEYFV
jgi:isoquinoline 1-oxidoreductase beta subunit